MLACIVAIAQKNVIGKQNALPWYLPADLRRFKQLTMGQAVIMGRKTADSIIARNGTPLPGRRNIVLTRDDAYTPEGFTVVHSMEAVQALVGDDDDAFVIGGEEIYKLFLPLMDRLYVTEIETTIDGDAFFPVIDGGEWREVSREFHEKDEKNAWNYSYVVYERV